MVLPLESCIAINEEQKKASDAQDYPNNREDAPERISEADLRAASSGLVRI
jgi:hypothetical protein